MFKKSKPTDSEQVHLASTWLGKSEFQGGGTTPYGLDNNRRQLSVNDRLHIVKVTANYLFAEPVGVNLGVFVRAMSGEPMYTDVQAAVNEALSEYVARRKRRRILELFSKLDWDPDYDYKAERRRRG